MLRALAQVVSALLPAAALALWAARSHPTTVAFGGMLGLLATLALAAVLAGLAGLRPAPAPLAPAEAAALLAAGAAATGWYWFRAWHHPGPEEWELAGVPVLIYTLVAFWWPGLFVAEVSWVLKRLVIPDATASLRATLLVGAIAGALGALGGKLASDAYYARVERVPLAHRLRQLALTTGAEVEHRLAGDRLEIDVRTALDRQPPYAALQSLEGLLGTGRALLGRKDVGHLTLVVHVPAGELARYEAARDERDAPVWSRVRLRRDRLAGAGRLDPESLRRMVQAPLWHPDRQHLFSYELTGDVLALAFRPDRPVDAATVALHAAAWASVNNIVNEVARYFPEVALFRIDLPPLAVEVPAAEVEPGAFRLQRRLLPAERVLALHVTQGTPRETFDPGRFFPGDGAGPFQIAVLREHFQLAYHVAGWLHEEIRLTPGVLFVQRVDPDGTVTLFLGEPEATGPLELRPGARAAVGEDEVSNLGWFDRARFAAPPRAAQR